MQNNKIIFSEIIENKGNHNKQLEGSNDPRKNLCIYIPVYLIHVPDIMYAKSQSIYMTTVFLSLLYTCPSIKSGGVKLIFSDIIEKRGN